MTRENRINSVFAIVLIAAMVPGAVILVKKKMQPGERPIGAPDPVRRTTAYMDPWPSASVPRLAPIRTLQWVGAIALSPVPASGANAVPTTAPAMQRVFRGDDAGRALASVPTPQVRRSVGDANFYGEVASGNPDAQVLSEGRLVQVVSFAPPTPPLTESPTSPSSPASSGAVYRLIVWDEEALPDAITAQADGTAVKPLSIQRLPVPKPIRHELQEAGYVLPPEHILVIDLGTAGLARELTLTWARKRDRVVLP